MSFVPKSKRKHSKIAGIFGTNNQGSQKSMTKSGSMDNIPEFFIEKVQNFQKYPPNLKKYIGKCFNQCKSEEQYEFVSDSLVKKISMVIIQGNILTYNWNNETLLPTEEIQQEVQKPKFSGTTSNSWAKFTKQAQNPQKNQQKQKSNDFTKINQKNSPKNKKESFINKQDDNDEQIEEDNGEENEENSIINELQEENQNDEINDDNDQNEVNTTRQYVYNDHVYNIPPGLSGKELKKWRKNIKRMEKRKNQLIQREEKAKQQKANEEQKNKTEIDENKPTTPEIHQLAAIAPGQTIKKKSKINLHELLLQKQEHDKELTKANQSPKTSPKIKQKKETNKPSSFMLDTSLEELQKMIVTDKKQKKKNKKGNNEEINFNPERKKQISRDMSLDEIIKENKIIGTSRALEKEYLRITGADLDPSMYRPPDVLRESFKYCMDKFHNTRNYVYIRDQLRSIRQDLTVQGIEDEFSVLVYETVTKLAIEHLDWDNFNQALNPLESLYADGFGKEENIAEISGYRIMYLIGFKDVTGLYSFIPLLDANIYASQPVQFALEAWKAISQTYWPKFFQLYSEATPLMRNVMTISIPSVRFEALEQIRRSIRTPSLEDYRTFLYFDTLDETKKYLDEREVAIPVR